MVSTSTDPQTNLALEELDQLWLPVHKDWRLNERHYGALQGLDKAQTAQKHGEAQVKIWRRSYDIAPPPLADGDPEPNEADIEKARTVCEHLVDMLEPYCETKGEDVKVDTRSGEFISRA